jgi:hypothetical protein
MITIQVFYKVDSYSEGVIEIPEGSGRYYRSLYLDDPTFEEEPESDCCYIEPTKYDYSITSKNVNQAIPDTKKYFNYGLNRMEGEMPIFIPLGNSGKKVTLNGYVYGKNILRLLRVYPDMLVKLDDDVMSPSYWEVEERTLSIQKSMPLYVRGFSLSLIRQFHTEDRP